MIGQHHSETPTGAGESHGVAPHRVVVVGGGPAAHRFVEALLDRRETPAGSPATSPQPPRDLSVTVLCEEACAPYDRVGLSQALVGDVDLTLGEPELWERDNVTLRTGEPATSIDTSGKIVSTDHGAYPYDDLVLATGSSAARPPIPGSQGASVYRTLEDVRTLADDVPRLQQELGRPPKAVVIGGGLLGLEAAGGMQTLGAEATVVNAAGWLLNAQIDEGGGQALGRLVSQTGLGIQCGVMPTEVLLDGDDQITGVALEGHDPIEADMVAIAIGVKPRDELAREAGLDIGPRGGAVIDLTCATSAPGIWAIGEVACFEDRCVGLVAPANAMAEVAADRILGGEATFAGFDTATKLKLAGVDVASFGDAHGTTPHSLEVVYADPARGMYQKLVVTDDAKTLLGGIFVGDTAPYMALRPLLGRELPQEPGSYLSSPSGGGADSSDLPDDAALCSCKNVAVGRIKEAINDEEAPCQDLGAVKSCTAAGTQCGSCVPMLKKLLDKELAKAGISADNSLCQHFPMTRAELYESIRVLELTSFESIVQRLGSGRGCDICKPTVASILASQHNDYVLDDGRGALQDTNDRALANMQKDGTYSVVPRVPAGEITPTKLAVIAQVATDFGLYTKITGAQRIDLFGARLDQLPGIWKRLVDAGFESGHAYGKALRTVKSCVGSTWCRYGVQDSVAMAIDLELRYRGLRAPHKIKLGVSGCARECAEARSKDVGVIATEDGWNLYVGGNGGFTPAHAQLLAQDLDDQTLVRYIDRFLMYYIRTADRLQRTARWIEDLDGGLDHVREVVMEDSLGIAGDLEQAMARHADTYRDEWSTTLQDPERLRRFRSFVNADEAPDTTHAYVIERGQRRPATTTEREGILPEGVTWAEDGWSPEPVMVAAPTIPTRSQED